MTLEFTSLTSFTKIFIETWNKQAPIKKKYIRKQSKFCYKTLTESNHAKIYTSEDFLKIKFFGV